MTTHSNPKVTTELQALVRELDIRLRVRLGVKVAVRDPASGEDFRHTVVAGGNVDLDAGQVSAESAVGSALLGARRGDPVTVRLPNGKRVLEVMDVGVDDRSDAWQVVAWILGKDPDPDDASKADPPRLFVPDPDQALRRVPWPADDDPVKLRAPWGLVLASDDVEVVEMCEKDGTAVDVIRPGARRVYRVRGNVAVRTPNSAPRAIETEPATASTNVEYRLHGKQHVVGQDGKPVFLGRVEMQEWQDGACQGVVPDEDLEWASDVPGAVWKPLRSGEAMLGWGTLRCVREGAVRRAVRLCALPADAALEFYPSADPRRGEVVLAGFGDIKASVVEPPSVQSKSRHEDSRYPMEMVAEDDAPPRTVVVTVEWHGLDSPTGAAKLPLPFPTEHAVFLGARGKALPTGSALTEEQLTNTRVEIVTLARSTFELTGEYVGHDATSIERTCGPIAIEVPAANPGRHVFDLAAVRSLVATAFEQSTDLHFGVRLHIRDTSEAVGARPTPSPFVTVTRFDLRLVRQDAGSAIVELDEASHRKTTRGDRASLALEALPLLDPALKPVPLPRAGDMGWRVPEGRLGPGPCLVVGRDDSRSRVWPMTWHVGPTEPPPDSATPRPRTAEEAYRRQLEGTEAVEAFQSVALEMSGTPGAEYWKLVVGYLKETSLPVQVFPLLEGLARTPRACATAAVVAEADDFDLVWERMQELPFAWWQVPLCCWSDALQAYAEHASPDPTFIGDFADIFGQAFESDINGRMKRLKARLDGQEEALDAIRQRILRDFRERDVAQWRRYGRYGRYCHNEMNLP